MAKCASLVYMAGLLLVNASGDCNADDKTSCSNADHSALLQGRVRVSLDADVKHEKFTYGPYPHGRKLIDYFKAWGQGKLNNRIANSLTRDIFTGGASFAQLNSGLLSAEEAAEAFTTAAAAECPNQAKVLEGLEHFKVLETEASDANGVRHVLIQKQGGELQYMAVRKQGGKHLALVADPPVCRSLSLAQGPELTPAAPGPENGAPSTLDLNDQSVKDCITLFHRTFKQNCKRDADIKVLAASGEVVDGVQVRLEAKVCHSPTDCHMHHPECDFETSPNHKDASLLEQAPVIDAPDETEEEKKGMTATLKLHMPLCDADTKEGTGPPLALMHTFGLGENSRSKGFEHVHDHLPVYTASMLDVGDVPAEKDLRTDFPACFPTLADKAPGTEVVRNQGTCGSCWAFASASTTMTNLCISTMGEIGTHNSANDRMEVSTQKIISCAAEDGSAQRGCNGGNMGNFDESAKKYGLTKEADNLYKCGGGDPANHFDETTGGCDAFPWGGTCTGQAQANWYWGGSIRLEGHDAMLNYIAGGSALYASFDVYANFFDVTSEIYTQTTGAKKGGHAVSLMGYGVDGSTKYWIMENSWGTDGFGQGGYAKFLRGANLAGIEEGAMGARAWVAGGTEPPCKDSADGTGLSTNGGMPPFIPCSQAKSGPYGDLCTQYATASSRCPLTCGTCTASNGSGQNMAPTPTPAPTPPPTPPPCDDMASPGINLNGAPATCSQLKAYCSMYGFIRDRCPATCNSCP